MKAYGILNSRMTRGILEKYFLEYNIEYKFFDSWFVFKSFLSGDYPDFIIFEDALIKHNHLEVLELVRTKIMIENASLELIVITGDNLESMRDKYNHITRVFLTNSRNEIIPYIENVIIRKNMEHRELKMKLHEINNKKSILFVDDSLLMHTHIDELFKPTEYEVIHAYDGLEGYDKYMDSSPSLVITDLEMPVMDGKTLCKKIKEKSFGKFIPLIVLTSSRSEIDMEIIYNYGADDYLNKPIRPEELLNKVNEYFCYKMKDEKILIIDESKMIREILTHNLLKRGYQAYQASNSRDGIEIAMQEKPDIMIVNHEIPHVNGYEVIREVKERPELANCRFVIIGSLNSRYDLKKGEQLGVEKYFVKPFNSDQLMLEIEHLLKEKYKEINIENKYMLRSIESLVKALEERDKYTQGHTERVTKYAVMLSRFMKISFEEIELIRLASSLHDIGKIGIPDRVLLKEGKLMDEEYSIIKEHVNKGTEILKPIKSLQSILPLIQHHHERWDGNGYPDKLIGDEIPMGARIIAVADAYDAITSSRPYRSERSMEEALDIITANAGTQFCPVIVKAFVSMMRNEVYLKETMNEIEIEDEKVN